jgi:hypothetical protein
VAESRTFVCNQCNKTIEAWSDGNPYYIDSMGERHYAYHPDHQNLAKCIGNDTPHLCLSCDYEFKVDSLSPTTECKKCNSENIADIYKLNGEKCPACHKGTFHLDPERFSVS